MMTTLIVLTLLATLSSVRCDNLPLQTVLEIVLGVIALMILTVRITLKCLGMKKPRGRQSDNPLYATAQSFQAQHPIATASFVATETGDVESVFVSDARVDAVLVTAKPVESDTSTVERVYANSPPPSNSPVYNSPFTRREASQQERAAQYNFT